MVRNDLWVPTARMWLDHPWLGVGPAHFDLRFPKYRPVTLQSRPFWSHNDYLNALADWGIVGGVLLGGVDSQPGVGRLANVAVRAPGWVGPGGQDERSGCVGARAWGSDCWRSPCTRSWISTSQIPSNAMLAVTFAALLSGHLRFTSNRYWLNPGLAGRVLITLLGGATAGLVDPARHRTLARGAAHPGSGERPRHRRADGRPRAGDSSRTRQRGDARAPRRGPAPTELGRRPRLEAGGGSGVEVVPERDRAQPLGHVPRASRRR